MASGSRVAPFANLTARSAASSRPRNFLAGSTTLEMWTSFPISDWSAFLVEAGARSHRWHSAKMASSFSSGTRTVMSSEENWKPIQVIERQGGQSFPGESSRPNLLHSCVKAPNASWARVREGSQPRKSSTYTVVLKPLLFIIQATAAVIRKQQEPEVRQPKGRAVSTYTSSWKMIP